MHDNPTLGGYIIWSIQFLLVTGMNNLDFFKVATFILKQVVGGNCPPRTPMGPEPLVCAVRGRREHEEQIEADARAVFTQVRAARMRKTLLLLGCVLS